MNPHRPLAGRRILFFCTSFFGYEKAITASLAELGAEVVFRGDRPYEGTWFKILLRLLPRIGRWLAQREHRSWLASGGGQKFDIIFVLKGEGVSPGLLRELRQQHSDAHFVLYLWDSLKNIPGAIANLPFFHQVFSFDRADCSSHPGFRYRPLFFLERYWNPTPQSGAGIFFIGTLNGDRPRVVQGVNATIGNHVGVKLDYWLFVRSGLEYRLRWLFDQALRRLDPQRLIRKPLSAEDISRRFAQAMAVLDIQHPNQTGLTMRTFEVLAAGKKLITTNPSIANEPFYDSTRIFIVDRYKPVIPAGFFSADIIPINQEFRAQYGIHGWVKEVLCHDGAEVGPLS